MIQTSERPAARLLLAEAFKTTGGQEWFALSLARAMAERGFDVAILTEPDTAMEPHLAGAAVSLYRCPRRGAYGWWRGIRAAMRSFRPDVVVLNGDRAGFYGRAYRALCPREARFVWVAHLHLDDVIEGWPFPQRATYRAAHRATLGFCDHIVAVSEQIAARLRDRDGAAVKKVTVIRNWARPTPPQRSLEALRREHAIPARALVVGVTGRLDRQKGHAHLLEAWRALPRGAGVLLVLGEGPLEKTLRSRAAALGVDGEVRFCGFREDVGSYLALFDIYALPSLYEGLPLALLEAMSCGLPIVASDLPGVREALGEPPPALLVEPGNSPELAAAIRCLFGDGGLRRHLGERARRRYEQAFTPEIVHAEYERFFRRFTRRRESSKARR